MSADSTPGVLGKFTLLEPIGSGGMARLYLARTSGLGGFEKRVVLKQIHPHLAQDAEFIARFIQEARLTATLDHPNIAAVYEVDVHEGIHFYAMEYVRGRDLRKVLRRAVERERVLAISEVVAIVSALCAGLHHAHGKRSAQGEPLGIVHRDVSPSNVLIGFEGAVKLTDFGVAKARLGMVTTDAGTLRGKIPYMSPEQCRGEALDRRSDVYAVGLLMWEMLTGTRLRREETEIAMIRTIADSDAPSPLALRAECPATLEKIVMQALERSAATRYQSASALQSALDEFGRETKLGASASSVAGLMEELFGEELLETFPSKRQAAVGTGTRELATATLAPVGVGVEAAFDEAPTRAVDLVAAGATDPVDPVPQLETRRSRSGLAVGLSLGVLVIAAGLYFAVTEPALAEPQPSEALVPAATPITKPREVIQPAPVAAAPDSAPAPDPASEVVLAQEPAPQPRPHRKKARRRRPRKQPRHGEDKALNLESAMPPGLDGG